MAASMGFDDPVLGTATCHGTTLYVVVMKVHGSYILALHCPQAGRTQSQVSLLTDCGIVGTAILTLAAVLDLE